MKLTVQNLCFSYKNTRTILDDLSFSYESPKILSILGPNGTGKSTLLKCLARQSKPTHGEIFYDGHSMDSFTAREFAAKVAYIPQSHTPGFPFDVLDVVLMGRTAKMGYWSTPSAHDKKIAYENLNFLGIEHLGRKPYTELSGGERQLVMIAAALTQEPELLLLDEPTAHLDFGNQHRFLLLVKRLRDRGMGILMTTHFPEHALEVSDVTAILSGGRFIRYGATATVIDAEVLSALYKLPIEIVPWKKQQLCAVLDQNPLESPTNFENLREITSPK